MIDPETRYRLKAECVVRQVDDEFILIPVNDRVASLDTGFIMNETGALIIGMLTGENSVNRIIDSVQDNYEVNRDQAANDVVGFLTRLDREIGLTGD